MSAENKAWVIDDERNIRWVLEKALTQTDGWLFLIQQIKP